MATMDQVLLAFPPDGHEKLADEVYDAAAHQFLQQISSLLREQTPAILASSSQLIQLLDPALNSISTLALINVLKSTNDSSVPVSRTELTELVVKFLQSFDGRQIRYMGDIFAHLVEEVATLKWVPGPQAVGLLASAVLRVDPAGEMLTTTHCVLATLAWDSGNFTPALPVIEKPYVFVPNMSNQAEAVILADRSASPASYISPATRLTGPLTQDAVMQYDYMCGLIFCSLRRWSQAHAAFLRILSFPSREGGVVKAMADAYKMWLLTGLLALGKSYRLPNSVHPTAIRQFEYAAKPYHNIATAFTAGNVEQFRIDVENHAKVWEDDANVDLIKAVQAGFQQWQIIRLSNIYSKLSIREVKEQTTSGETGRPLDTVQGVEALVRDMITSGQLRGALGTHPDGTTSLEFLPPGGELSEEEFATEMGERVRRLQTLGRVVRSTDWRLMTSKEYVKVTVHEQKRGSQKDGAGMDAGFGFDHSIEDEDLMLDVSQQN